MYDIYRYAIRCCIGIVCVGMGIFGSVFANFPDIADHDYRDSILFLQAREVVKGYPDGTFGPDRGVTRAEMLKILLESTRDVASIGTGSNCFVDVLQQRYAPYICHAKEHAIVKGYPGNIFKPDQEVTVGEGLKIALGIFGHEQEEQKGRHRYQFYVDFVHDNNIFSKYALFPDRAMTRGQMSYLVHQLLLEQENIISFTGIRDNRSPGCFTHTAPKTAPTSSVVDGMQRNYITTVGRSYDHDEPTQFVIAFHGRTSPNSEVRRYYKLERVWDDDAIIVYPAGLPEEGPSRSRQSPGDPSDDLRDFALFDTLVEEFGEQYCIDMDEVYVVGHSLGAWFTNTLACARGDIIRGIGSVGGSITRNDCTGPVAAMIMHHPDDTLAWFGGGLAARDHLLYTNACGAETKEMGPADANCVAYTDCIEGAPVVWCPHEEDHARWDGSYYPHTWPSFAANLIWHFWDDLG